MLLSNLTLLATAPEGVARLRELILTLAVQGKLVPQDLKDEPASELLKKIRLEKDRLIAEGKIKRDKTLAKIAEEEKPFGLPNGWEWARWAEIAMMIGDIDHKMPSEVSDGLPYVSARDFFGKNEIDFAGAKKIGRSDFLELASKIRPEKGDLIYPRYGTIGVIRMVMDNREFLASYSCAVIKVLRGCIEPGYQYLFSMSDCVKRQATSATNKTTQPNVGLKSIQGYLVPVPPLVEQSRIVTRVEELMRLCDALEAKGQLEATQHAQLVSTLLATLTDSETPAQLTDNWHRIATHFNLLLDRPQAVDALEQTILQLAVRGLLVPQDLQDEPASELLKKIRNEKDRLIAEGKIKPGKPLAEIAEEDKPFGLPKGWEWVRLNSLLQKIGAGSTPLGGREVYAYSGVKFLRSQNVYDDGLRLHAVAYIKPETHANMTGTVVVANDLLFNITGASIGRCAVVPNDFDEANVSQHVTIVRTVFPALNAFLHKVLVSRHIQQAVMDVQVGVSREGLSIAKLSQFLIPVPPLAEQSRIVARVGSLHALCANLRQRLITARTQQALLAEVLVKEVA